MSKHIILNKTATSQLRDEFAKIALAGILTDDDTRGYTTIRMAKISYNLADEMIKIREGGDNE